MKYIIFLLIAVNLFAYDYSKIIPKSTFFYLSVNDSKKLKEKFTKTSFYQFIKTENYTKIEKEISELIPLYIENKDFVKVFKNINEFTGILEFPFAIIGDKTEINQNHFIDFALISNDKKFYEKIDGIVKLLFLTNKIKDTYKLYNQDVKGINVAVIEQKTDSNEYSICYTVIDDNLIITTSLKYMEKLISHIKNTSLQTLAKNETFQRYKKKYTDSDIDLYINGKELSLVINKYFPSDVKNKQIFDINKFEGFYGTISLNSENTFDANLYVIDGKNFDGVVKSIIVPNSVITAPAFISNNVYSFLGFQINLPEFYKFIMDNLSDIEKERILQYEQIAGISLKTSIFENIGPNFYNINIDKNTEEGLSAFIFDIKKTDVFLSVIKKISTLIPEFQVKTDSYLDGKLLSFNESKDVFLGVKNQTVIFGDKSITQEIMQFMTKNETQFKDTTFYQKILSKKQPNQILLFCSNTGTGLYYDMKTLLKNITQKEKTETNTEETAKNKKIKKILTILSSLTKEEYQKYLGFTFIEIYTKGNDIVATLNSMFK